MICNLALLCPNSLGAHALSLPEKTMKNMKKSDTFMKKHDKNGLKRNVTTQIPFTFINKNLQKSNTNLPCSSGFVALLLLDF